MGKGEVNLLFMKEEVQVAKKHRKRCSTNIQKMPITLATILKNSTLMLNVDESMRNWYACILLVEIESDSVFCGGSYTFFKI